MLRNTASALVLFALAAPLAARDHLQIAGSSTVLPYASIVAELFGENFDFPVPIIESGGSSAGLKKFCAGIGPSQIDIANASRPMRDTERATCAANGVSEIIEVRFGYDGIVFAGSIDRAAFDFTTDDWYRALAAEVVMDGKLVPNPYRTWDEIDPLLPRQEIEAYIPGSKHGTREVFDDKVILAGCDASGAAEVIRKMKGEAAVRPLCTRLRKDGRAIEIDGDYTEILARIETNRRALGVFGLSFYENNTDKLRLARFEGVFPSAETVASGAYPVARPLYFYVKKAHFGVIPGLKDFATFFVSEDVDGAEGPLAGYGLVPDPDRAAVEKAVRAEEVLR